MSDTVNNNPAVVDPSAPKYLSKPDGTNVRQVQDNSFASSLNIQLSVNDVTNIGVVQAEEILRVKIAENAKALGAARKLQSAASTLMQKTLTDTAAAAYETHNKELTEAFNTSQWTFTSDNTFQFIEGRSGAPDRIRVDASVTAKYRGPCETFTGKTASIDGSFNHPVPVSYYDAKTAYNTHTATVTTLEEESMTLRREMSNLPSLERKAKAAITESILRTQGQDKMIETVKAQNAMTALPPGQ